MFIEPAIIGLSFALIKGGKIRNIGKLHINAWYLFLISAAIQIFLSLGKGLNLDFVKDIIDDYFFCIYLFTYILLAIGILLNINKKFMKFIFIGILLNAIVIFSNGGKMPVSINGFQGIDNYVEIADRDFDIKHTSISESTNFRYLGDIILIAKPYPLARIMSIGDIFMMIGVFIFFPENMIHRRKEIHFLPYLTKNQR